MSGLAEKNVRTSRKMSGLALFKSASPMDYQSIKSAVHPGHILLPPHLSPIFMQGRCIMILASMWLSRTLPPSIPFYLISALTLSNHLLFDPSILLS